MVIVICECLWARVVHGRFGISSPRCTAGRARQRSSQAGTCLRLSNHEVAGTVEANEVARPAEQGNVGNAVFLLHHPPPSVEMLLEYAEQAPRFRDVALERTLVGDLLAGKFVEIADLAEHRSDAAHLEMHPLD